MTLDDWLDYIGQLHTSAIDLGLSRVRPLAKVLQIDRFACPVVIVGGTNGKGSVVRALEIIHRCAGFNVAAYTSPHLLKFNERLRINDQRVDDAHWLQAFAVVEVARGSSVLSFFEFTTLAALWLCQQHPLDLVILEVGLGGRLDAVNIIDADVAVVTNVDIDHVEWLGHDREQIGREKAGIFRPKGLAVCGDPKPPASLLEFATQHSVQLFCYQKDYTATCQEGTWTWQGLERYYQHLPLPRLKLQNMATAIMATALLGLSVSEPVLFQAMSLITLPGRYEFYQAQCPVIFDVAHNPQAAHYLAERFLEEPVQGRRYAVVGMLKDKDIRSTLAPFFGMIDAWYVGSLLTPRGADGLALFSILKEEGVALGNHFDTVTLAFEAALASAAAEDAIVVFGSFHTVAEVKRAVNGV